jgi:hypothetical protein
LCGGDCLVLKHGLAISTGGTSRFAILKMGWPLTLERGGGVSGGTARYARLTRMARFAILKHGLAVSPERGGRGGARGNCHVSHAGTGWTFALGLRKGGRGWELARGLPDMLYLG